MPNVVQEFFKAQFSAFTGGTVDYLTMIFCVEVLSMSVGHAIMISGVIGAVVNFSINRYWTFRQEAKPLQDQLWKFVMVVMGSIFLKSQGTPLLTEWTGIDYKITRLMVELVVSLGFNFTLQKYWVFRK